MLADPGPDAALGVLQGDPRDGEVEQTLTHNGVVVAVIAKVEKSYIDLDYLAEKHPKAYADSLRKRDEFHIRKPAPQK